MTLTILMTAVTLWGVACAYGYKKFYRWVERREQGR